MQNPKIVNMLKTPLIENMRTFRFFNFSEKSIFSHYNICTFIKKPVKQIRLIN
ncbi:hypothetical protein PSKAS_39420 [Peribacillus sp. N1]